jgi:hypothetical protein
VYVHAVEVLIVLCDPGCSLDTDDAAPAVRALTKNRPALHGVNGRVRGKAEVGAHLSEAIVRLAVFLTGDGEPVLDLVPNCR